ncbi:hypothetical protein FBX98_12066 [Burkholderia sp. SJZ115]|nr:hypothetical protein FB600_12080 [Burkholderia sp. SJZ089]TWC95762.1 hypothetical protein FBX98_12066 [Burkholderia sp. SJZ115]TWC99069.1 hypothetical protein FB601_11965 [Burkholderia sp. SJZ091]
MHGQDPLNNLTLGGLEFATTFSALPKLSLQCHLGLAKAVDRYRLQFRR